MSAVDKLGMSLDAIIASKAPAKKPFQKKSFDNANSNTNRKNGGFRSQKTHVVKSSNAHDDRVGGKFDGGKDRVERPLKVVTIERPKVIQPGSQPHHHQSNQQASSVFNRLGKSGSVVIFRNLKRSVLQNDIFDLCRACGDLKEVTVTHDHGNVNTARALFSNERDAAACVAKYNGLTLDGLEMAVTVEAPSQSVFNRLESSTAATGGHHHMMKFDPTAASTVGNQGNVRSGLFGTALPTQQQAGALSQHLFQATNVADDEDDEEAGFTRKVTVAQGNRKITVGAGRVERRQGGRGGQGKGQGRGGGRGGKPRRNSNNNNDNDVDLDDDLEQYMADR